jgi:hypothetical protein
MQPVRREAKLEREVCMCADLAFVASAVDAKSSGKSVRQKDHAGGIYDGADSQMAITASATVKHKRRRPSTSCRNGTHRPLATAFNPSDRKGRPVTRGIPTSIARWPQAGLSTEPSSLLKKPVSSAFLDRFGKASRGPGAFLAGERRRRSGVRAQAERSLGMRTRL